MDWLQFFSSVMGAVAWPLALVGIALLFRTELRKLLARIREVSGPGGTGAKFVDELEGAREAAGSFSLPSATGQINVDEGVESPTNQQHDRRFFELVENYPEAAILYTYQELEKLIEQYWRRYWVAGKTRMRTPIAFLGSIEQVSKDTIELYKRIQKTRNAAVHANAEIITPGEAIEFKELSEKLKFALEKAFKEAEMQIGVEHQDSARP